MSADTGVFGYCMGSAFEAPLMTILSGVHGTATIDTTHLPGEDTLRF